MKFMSLLTFAISMSLLVVSVYMNIMVFTYISIFAIVLSAIVFFDSIKLDSKNQK